MEQVKTAESLYIPSTRVPIRTLTIYHLSISLCPSICQTPRRPTNIQGTSAASPTSSVTYGFEGIGQSAFCWGADDIVACTDQNVVRLDVGMDNPTPRAQGLGG